MTTTPRPTGSTQTKSATQYLTIRLADEEYAIPILRVQEIRGVAGVTRIANAPSHVRGVMNLRGSVTPIVDLRVRLGMPAKEATPMAATVVVNVGDKFIGLVVDSVSDVQNFESDSIEPPPQLGASVDTAFLNGMAKQDDRLIALLDLDRVFGIESHAA